MKTEQAIKHFENEIRFCERAPAGNPVHQTADWVMILEANKAALAALREKLERENHTDPQWISVTERLPEEWVDVLALLKCGGCVVVVRSGRKWRERWNNELMDRPPTHWMPLPKPPKMVGGAEQ